MSRILKELYISTLLVEKSLILDVWNFAYRVSLLSAYDWSRNKFVKRLSKKWFTLIRFKWLINFVLRNSSIVVLSTALIFIYSTFAFLLRTADNIFPRHNLRCLWNITVINKDTNSHIQLIYLQQFIITTSTFQFITLCRICVIDIWFVAHYQKNDWKTNW